MNLPGLPARADAANVDDRVAALVPQVGDADAGVRKKALAELQRLGVAALPAILRCAGATPGSPEWEAAVAAAVAVDPEQALAAVQSCRTAWPSLGWLAEPEGRRGVLVVDVLEERIAAARKVAPLVVKLDAATLDDGFRVPPDAEWRVEGTLPSELLWEDVACREARGALEVDAAGDGRFATRVDGTRAQVVAVGPKARPRKALVYRRLGRWYAASPHVLRGAIGRTPVELLDVEADGDFGGARDLVRFGDDAAFRPVAEAPFAWAEGRLFRFRLRRENGAPVLHVVPEPEPHWLVGPTAAHLAALHAWRTAAGFAPQRADAERSAACRLHHDFWTKNGFTGHDEDPGAPGRTEEGARAGERSSVSEDSDGADFVRTIAATILHRDSLIGPAREPVGLHSGDAGSLLWGAPIDGSARGAPTIVPGAGQSAVPCLLEPELPLPASDATFYARSRGYPVSIAWGGLAVRPASARKLELFAGGATKPLPGTTFCPETPYGPEFTAETTVFVADEPLASGTLHTARFTAQGPQGPIEVVWQFRTR